VSYDPEELRAGIVDLFTELPTSRWVDTTDLIVKYQLRIEPFTDESLLEEARTAKPLPKIHPPIVKASRRSNRGSWRAWRERNPEKQRAHELAWRAKVTQEIREIRDRIRAWFAPTPLATHVGSVGRVGRPRCPHCNAYAVAHRCPVPQEK
jgi:hypothetical protein